MTNTLTAEQKKLARRAATPNLPEPTPTWADIGEDKRKELFQEFLKRLRKTDNNTTTNIIAETSELGYIILQEKIKSMQQRDRRQERKSQGNTQSQQNIIPGSGNTAAPSDND
ncbi:hypothetical protein M406DRAFT_354878 [Cryphonectria parasitica EP155]|uniref:Uncharacterized protein n=1 Tax=Cryphonectria parasitica (strain ATCC 38755 / EP155) TaxID=660469 RepID=A0A9P4Y7H7_CRYP1|nr:uncharacterized protein M406DRAFT_354878 [Cryphonectria parasitica EP155]KAF3768337.1 hypothetical protein M406DRAFT_354878 [Cryphonectria parasitica EP155]